MTAGRTLVLVLESTEPEKLAQFYARLLDAEIHVEPDLTHLRVADPRGTHLLIRRNEQMVPPVWPQTGVTQPQLHLTAADVDAAERDIVALGGHPLDIETQDDNLTFTDPEGHPFTLVKA